MADDPVRVFAVSVRIPILLEYYPKERLWEALSLRTSHSYTGLDPEDCVAGVVNHVKEAIWSDEGIEWKPMKGRYWRQWGQLIMNGLHDGEDVRALYRDVPHPGPK